MILFCDLNTDKLRKKRKKNYIFDIRSRIYKL